MPPQSGSTWRLLVPRSLEARLVAIACSVLIAAGALAEANDWRAFLPQIDLSTYYLAGRALNQGGSPYDDADRGDLEGAFSPAARSAWIPYLYPPPFAAAMRVAAVVPYRWFAAIWLAVNACVLAAAYGLVWRLYAPRRTVAALVTLSLLAPASLDTLLLGQVNGLILLCLAAALWQVTRRSRPGVAGALIGVAATLKIFPLALPLTLPRRSLVRAAPAAGLVVALLALVGLLAGGGLQAYAAWPDAVERATVQFTPNVSNQSLAGVLHRGFSMRRTVTARTEQNVRLFATIAIGLVSATVILLPSRRPLRIDIGLRWSVLLLAACIALPLSWDHYFVFLVLPVAVLVRTIRAESPIWRLGAAGLLCLLAHRYSGLLVQLNVPLATSLGLAGSLLLWMACVSLLLVQTFRRRAVTGTPQSRAAIS